MHDIHREEVHTLQCTGSCSQACLPVKLPDHDRSSIWAAVSSGPGPPLPNVTPPRDLTPKNSLACFEVSIDGLINL